MWSKGADDKNYHYHAKDNVILIKLFAFKSYWHHDLPSGKGKLQETNWCKNVQMINPKFYRPYALKVYL
jgi:hypothetical protein